jgi:hypothetical protein
LALLHDILSSELTLQAPIQEQLYIVRYLASCATSACDVLRWMHLHDKYLQTFYHAFLANAVSNIADKRTFHFFLLCLPFSSSLLGFSGILSSNPT